MAARIGIVGASWRGEYFLRAAATLPEHFEVARLLTRTDASAERAAAKWGVATTTSLDDFRAGDYDFIVVATPPDVAPDVTVALARDGHAVLTETPPAPTREALFAFWEDVRDLRVQVAEQYRFQAHHAARLAVAQSGRLGDVSLARMSVAHGYHGVSLIRAFLGAGFEPVSVSGWAAASPVVSARGRDDWNDSPVEYTSNRTFARLDFAGRTGLYEFDFEQYFSPIRPRRIEIHGARGQIADDDVSYVVGPRHATTGTLQRTATGADGDLEGWFVDAISWGDDIVWQNRFRGARLNDDEVAVAELMHRMAVYAAGGEPAYPAADGCHDQLLSLAINDAVGSGATLRVEDVPWMAERSILAAERPA
ncbi:Gfo/Idh/MocA family protein [Microbacterium sp. ASV49]|uniref:Gfo/Idh/MocA family oxidoreductase n=1 Tax=Microbacterium candidum TaxID=3041922 RepID=A0ABT7MWB5_9MICO|nr:Gfo/Idh/MocA family oxidoreductase [Microbacterium sp. ASV49]MDL9978743.1 Gfo/Idh/MocA family oxidoreductase [Microbacterium sp. ASV49]